MKKKLLFETSGIIKAPLERVADLLFADGPPTGTHTSVDRKNHTIAYWGNWWYRGEDSLEPHPEGTRLVHRVFNIAPQGNLPVYLANKLFIGYQAKLDAGMRKRVAEYTARLG
ncbi:hypothetical protein Lesp02_05260 [Lentzea sp. NBRC 105346]|uniref:hypothetical protein n=1 Tax=Lentzea sp. NBRC 105346 TaxID=3032205 RepID=UPI0024A19CAC|nr:hypothetical protein [Lentzea sp. NBRC 105346]GLZ28336.1 hypothetical protein Lesp02_05260 [Lentzea sp. NBRC 105346]